MPINKNNNVLLESFDKLKKHPKFTFKGVVVPSSPPHDIRASPENIKKSEHGKKHRFYIGGTSSESDVTYAEEPIDSSPETERVFGIESHMNPSSYFNNRVWVTVHKMVGRMGGSDPFENKMGGMASVSCSQVGTRACAEKYEKGLAHNKKIDNAKALLIKLDKKKNKTDEDAILAEQLVEFLSQAKYNICGKCYAHLGEIGLKAGTIQPKYKSQGELLRSKILEKHEIPTFLPGEVIRINAHGDLENGESGIIQFINYLNMAYHNPQSYIVMWTKQIRPINEAYRRIGYRKPKNMTIIYSNPWIDKVMFTPPTSAPWADGVFNVVMPENFFKIKSGDIVHNGRTIKIIKCNLLCRECRACYSGLKNFAVIELEKNAGRAWKKKNPEEFKEGYYKRIIRIKRQPRKIDIQKYIPMPVRFFAVRRK